MNTANKKAKLYTNEFKLFDIQYAKMVRFVKEKYK